MSKTSLFYTTWTKHASNFFCTGPFNDTSPTYKPRKHGGILNDPLSIVFPAKGTPQSLSPYVFILHSLTHVTLRSYPLCRHTTTNVFGEDPRTHSHPHRKILMAYLLVAPPQPWVQEFVACGHSDILHLRWPGERSSCSIGGVLPKLYLKNWVLFRHGIRPIGMT
jgi:hypothetical protein